MVDLSLNKRCGIRLALFYLCLCITSITQALTLEAQWGNNQTADHRIDGIFAVWWDKKWDHYDDAGTLVRLPYFAVWLR